MGGRGPRNWHVYAFNPSIRAQLLFVAKYFTGIKYTASVKCMVMRTECKWVKLVLTEASGSFNINRQCFDVIIKFHGEIFHFHLGNILI